MRFSTAAALALATLAACRNDGSCRPAPPDPEPASVPVDVDDPDKPIEQPSTPGPAKPEPAPPK